MIFRFVANIWKYLGGVQKHSVCKIYYCWWKIAIFLDHNLICFILNGKNQYNTLCICKWNHLLFGGIVNQLLYKYLLNLTLSFKKTWKSNYLICRLRPKTDVTGNVYEPEHTHDKSCLCSLKCVYIIFKSVIITLHLLSTQDYVHGLHYRNFPLFKLPIRPWWTNWASRAFQWATVNLFTQRTGLPQ